MSPAPPDSDDPEYVDWPIDTEENHRYLGTVVTSRAPVFYAPDQGAYRGEVDAENQRLVPDEEASWEVQPEETLGEFLERIGDEAGWEHLSEFAREHLEEDES